ncbi:hypothetical protein HQ393_15405 [Chitinibacter bivalviorum]|uniref:Sugar ABC transporter n=1 Tax=Chitinibacter bivalviorum TaxID=2739434 RepID=A0A7H9BNB7_9NEIS|nr:hypothetical protein [Chitinibacter bivalviorum]QLG89521.1 hypothetical protein HQ393_15405 [Chitinibacter bivalviorum]
MIAKRFLLLALLVIPTWALALPHVLIIESYHPENSWDREYIQGIKSKLDGMAELSFFSLDTKRLPTDDHLNQATLAFRFMHEVNPELVILGDDAALALMGPKLARMKMPTVFLGINADPTRYFENGKLPSTLTGVLERPQYKSSFALINELLPKARRILVLLDQERTSPILRDEIAAVADARVHVQIVTSFEDWKNKVTQAPEQYDAILLGPYQALLDMEQNNVDAQQVIHWTYHNSKIPLFGFWDFQIGREAALGGAVITGFEQGAVAGAMAKAQLQLPQQTQAVRPSSPARIMLSRSQIERWKMTVPATLRNRVSWLP